MKRVLSYVTAQVYYFDETGAQVDGVHSGITGDISGITGDISGITGDISGNLTGDISLSEITDDERQAGVAVADLIIEEGK